MENKDFWKFENSANAPKEATLYIYGDIINYDFGEHNFPDDVVPNKFKNELAKLGDVDTINVRINSGGGSVYAAYSIMNLLKSHKAKVIAYIDGIAASAATLIAMAGDKIIAATGSIWMIHLPLTHIVGNAKQLQKGIDILNTLTTSMVDVYHAKTKIDKDNILQMMQADTWLTGKQAHESGFVDEMVDLEVVAYLDKDKRTAFFNGQKMNIGNIRNKETLTEILNAMGGVLDKTDTQCTKNITQPKAVNSEAKKEAGMNLADFKAKHQDIYNEAVQEGITQGIAQGAQNERARIAEIENMALPGMEALANAAKFERSITPAEFAMEMVKAQKQQGVSFLQGIAAETQHLNDVPAVEAPLNMTSEIENALIAEVKADTGEMEEVNLW